jgi:hypothetical protein
MSERNEPSDDVAGDSPPDRFNESVLRTVDMLLRERAGGGYDLNSYFTRNLAYGPGSDRVKANHPPLTMCVAAVTEVIIEALNLYHRESGDVTPFRGLPIRSWQRGSMHDIRAHIFQYDGAKCNGTAHALARFGIGRQLPFEALQPGDFITMNRTSGSGHTAVFLGYIDRNYAELASYSSAVAGFKYFSAQGKGSSDAGFAYRWAFFSPSCPAPATGKRRDCGIIRSSKQALLNTGCMLHPRAWSVHPPQDGLEADAEPSTELLPSDLSRYDGVTTD